MALAGNISTKPPSLQGNVGTTQRQISGNLPGSLIFGVNGATFYPHVSEDGWLSWTNDRNLPNPEPVRITGTVDEETVQQIIEEYLADNLPEQFKPDGETLVMNNGILSVQTTDEVTEGDNRPITSGAVYDEFSKAVALLRTV